MALTLAGVVAAVAAGLLIAVNIFGAVSGAPRTDATKPAVLASAVATAAGGPRKAPAAIPKPDPIDMRPPAIAAVEPTKEPAPKPAPRKPAARHITALPDRLAWRGDSRQLIIVTSPDAQTSDGRVQLFNKGSDGNWREALSTPTRLGKNGLVEGRARQQGSATTPTGVWVLGSFGFGGASSAPQGARVPWRQIKDTTYWTSEQGSSYNTWVDSSHALAGEHLLDSAGQAYEFAIDSGYNAPPNESVYGRGSGIFVHVMHPGYTQGCVSIPRSALVKLLQLVEPARHPRCVVGTADRGTATSIWKY
jgi:L,D-peptidoglycan transpeptidase YkuD (ErfK/YbiS/YcfS/YnhG family)